MNETFNLVRGTTCTGGEDCDSDFQTTRLREPGIESPATSAVKDLETSHEVFTDSWTTLHRQLSRDIPARLDLTQVPVNEKTFTRLSNVHRKVYMTYHRYTVFELDMIHCTNGCFSTLQDDSKRLIEESATADGSGDLTEMRRTERKTVFYPSMLLPDSSHKRSIQKLAVRFM